MPRYNPHILGFAQDGRRYGEVWIPLQEALDRFGDLPSRYGILNAGSKSRSDKRTLNLLLGTAVTAILREVPDLKRHVAEFYQGWHRDWEGEFGIDYEPLFNRADCGRIVQWIRRHPRFIRKCEALDARALLASRGLIKKDVLNSIPDRRLLAKATEILERKIRNPPPAGVEFIADLQDALTRIRRRKVLDRLNERLGTRLGEAPESLLRCYADEIAEAIGNLAPAGARAGVALPGDIAGDIEFAFARRNHEILNLGNLIGDCTAKPFRQIDTHTQNIYWTVFPWLLDRNYLILKVLYRGHLVAKAHLLPLVAYEPDGMKLFLAVDALETGISMRHDLPGGNRLAEWECRAIFDALHREVIRIADAAGFSDVYAELFSNNSLARQWLESFDKVYLDVSTVHKVDELEDVFLFALQLTDRYDLERPDHVFMELQFRNTHLMSHHARQRHLKGFASLRRGSLSGHSMSRVIGI